MKIKNNPNGNRHTTYAPNYTRNTVIIVNTEKEPEPVKAKIEFVENTEELRNELDLKANVKRMSLDFTNKR